MKLGFLSDAHGNMLGFSLCLRRLKEAGAEKVLFLGDVFGYLPMGLSVFNVLLREKIVCVKGNHDAMVTGELSVDEGKEEVYRIKAAKNNITDEQIDYVRARWPLRRDIVEDGCRIACLHGRPKDPLEGYCYEDDYFEPEEFHGEDVIVMGHTHKPYVKRRGNTLCINSGSCGLPRDVGNCASCAVYDTNFKTAEILCVVFDVEKVIDSCPKDSVSKEVIDCLRRKNGIML